MKHFTLILFMALTSTCVQGQNEYNMWTFGLNAGLDFNTDPPSVFDCALTSIESCGTICDHTGALLFYTNGGAFVEESIYPGGVWNANHELMPNGDLSQSVTCQSSFYAPMVIKDPGTFNEYYIFHMDCSENAYDGGLRYHKVDMTLENGLGDVTEKDVAVHGAVNEGLMCIWHENETHFWLIVKEANSDSMLSFLVTEDGIQPPVITTLETTDPAILFSDYNGEQIVVQASGITYMYLFDNETGTLSLTGSFLASQAYKSFSPSGEFLYRYGFNATTLEAEIIQIDFSDLDNIIETSVGIAGGLGWPIHLAPDGKMYMTDAFTSTMHRINNPDLPGELCNFEANAIDLGTGQGAYGLPLYPVPRIESNPTAIENLSNPDIRVFPNPAKTAISFSKTLNNQTALAYNSLGAKVEVTISGNQADISNLASGLYTLVFLQAGETSTLKFVKD